MRFKRKKCKIFLLLTGISLIFLYFLLTFYFNFRFDEFTRTSLLRQVKVAEFSELKNTENVGNVLGGSNDQDLAIDHAKGDGSEQNENSNLNDRKDNEKPNAPTEKQEILGTEQKFEPPQSQNIDVIVDPQNEPPAEKDDKDDEDENKDEDENEKVREDKDMEENKNVKEEEDKDMEENKNGKEEEDKDKEENENVKEEEDKDKEENENVKEEEDKDKEESENGKKAESKEKSKDVADSKDEKAPVQSVDKEVLKTPCKDCENKIPVNEDNDLCVEVDKTKTYDENVTFPEFIEVEDPKKPHLSGAYGTSVVIKNLTTEEKAQKDKDFKTNYFDEWVSKLIDVRRPLRYDPPEGCKEQHLTNASQFPPVSVLIVFYNEAWTTLLRTIHSILDRTPDHMLHEIILLDDFSNMRIMKHLGDPLELYLQRFKKVRLLRARERLGLIRARNTVFNYAQSEIVVFLDSHIECYPYWLEPLVAPIVKDSRTIVFPRIEIIDASDFSVRASDNVYVVGGLNIDGLTFNWLYKRSVSNHEEGASVPSPTMPGGLYAVSRDWFIKLGQYDPGLDYWGGENIEISFKSWMCGGSILASSCSHVGHIFRVKNPTLQGFIITSKNSVRVAEVWMDEYKHYYYERIGYKVGKYGDVTHRKHLRSTLQCKSFDWYVKNVFPELLEQIDVTGLYFGQVKNENTSLCLDRRGHNRLYVKRCGLFSPQQYFHLKTDGILDCGGGRIVTVDSPMVKGREEHKVVLTNPKHLDKKKNNWVYDESHRFVHMRTGRCLEAQLRKAAVILEPCSSTSNLQRWSFTTRKELRNIMKENHVSIGWDE